MLYSCIILIANYDSWKDGAKVNAKTIKKIKNANKEKIEKLIENVIKKIGEIDWDKEIENLKVTFKYNPSVLSLSF